MPILKLIGKTDSCEGLVFEVNGVQKVMLSGENRISFSVEAGKQKIVIREQLDELERNPLWKLLDVFTLPVQGVINGLLMNSELDWEKDVKPICMKAELTVDVEKDTDIEVFYNPTRSEVFTQPDLPVFISVQKNEAALLVHYCRAVKKLISIETVLLILFGFLFWAAWRNGNTFASVFTLLLIIVSIVLLSALIYQQHQKYRKLALDF